MAYREGLREEGCRWVSGQTTPFTPYGEEWDRGHPHAGARPFHTRRLQDDVPATSVAAKKPAAAAPVAALRLHTAEAAQQAPTPDQGPLKPSEIKKQQKSLRESADAAPAPAPAVRVHRLALLTLSATTDHWLQTVAITNQGAAESCKSCRC